MLFFKYERKVNESMISKESQKIVFQKQSGKTVHLKKIISKPPKVKYDLWINERIVTFCFFLNEPQKDQSEIPAVRKSKAKSKAGTIVPRSTLHLKTPKLTKFIGFLYFRTTYNMVC